jgi:hypothetical protein
MEKNMANNENTREFHEKVFNKMGTEEFRNDLIALLRIRSPLIYLVCNEEKRMLTFFKHLSIAQGYKTYVWDCFLGIQDIVSNQPTPLASEEMKDPEVILDHIIKSAQQDKQNAESMGHEGIKGNIYILLDYHRFLQDAMPGLERRLKQITKIEKRFTSVILVGPSFVSTPSLEDYFRVIDFPFPNKEEISIVLMSLATDDKITLKIPALAAEAKKEEDELIKAVNGLTLNDAQDAFTKSIVKFRKFHIPTILKEKQQIIRKRGILEYYEPNVDMSNVGGLKNLVRWLEKRKLAFASDAEAYGLRQPRGLLFCGPPGCVLGNVKIRIKKILNKGKHNIYEE